MGQGRILVIEDEAGIRGLIKKVLEPAYAVHLAERGQDGLNQASSRT
jgi:DNA-binding response OmpR family regulator